MSGNRITVTGEYRVALDLKLPAGTYTITWTVVSATSREGIRFGYTDGTTSADFTSSPFTINTSGKEIEKIYLYVGTLGVSVSETTIYENIQIEIGSTASAYVPFTVATNIEHTLPETVYGGELDVETGVLKVTYAEVDMGGLTWSYNAGEVTFRANIVDVKNVGKAFCSAYKMITGAPVSNLQGTTLYSYYTSAPSVWVKDTDYTDADVFKTAVTGQKLVYELDTPYEIQLTPYEVNLLTGANVITTNGTSITLVYREGEIAALSDVKAVNDFLKTGLDALDNKAVKQTSGELDAKLNANETAAAVLSNLMLRDIKIQTTAVTPGDDASEPDGTIIIVYEP